MTIEQRITDYLSSGGLFNPEMMEHEKVRDLLIKARDLLEQLRKERDELRAVLLRCRDTVGIYISCAGHHSDGDDPCPRCEIASQIKKVLSTT